MKKKVKLITTIASLCLAVALMAFGVYAAGSATFGTSAKVSYTVSGQVHAQMEVRVLYTTDSVNVTGDNSLETGTPGEGETGLTVKTKTETVTPDLDITAASKTVVLGNYAFKPTTVKTNKVVFEITIKNLGQYEIIVTASGLPTPTTTDNQKAVKIELVSCENGSKTLKKTSEQGASVTYKVTYTLADPTVDEVENGLEFKPSFTLKHSEN